MKLFKNKLVTSTTSTVLTAKEMSLQKEINLVETIVQGVDNILFLPIVTVVILLIRLTNVDSTPFIVDDEDNIDYVKAYETWINDGTFKKAKKVIGVKKYNRLERMIQTRYKELSNSISKMMPSMEELNMISEYAKEMK